MAIKCHISLVNFKTKVTIISFEMSSACLQLSPLVSTIRMTKGWSGQFLQDINSWDHPLSDKTFPAVNDHCQTLLGLTPANSPETQPKHN